MHESKLEELQWKAQRCCVKGSCCWDDKRLGRRVLDERTNKPLGAFERVDKPPNSCQV